MLFPDPQVGRSFVQCAKPQFVASQKGQFPFTKVAAQKSIYVPPVVILGKIIRFGIRQPNQMNFGISQRDFQRDVRRDVTYRCGRMRSAVAANPASRPGIIIGHSVNVRGLC